MGRNLFLAVLASIIGFIWMLQIWVTRFYRFRFNFKARNLKGMFDIIVEMIIDIAVLFFCLRMFGTQIYAILTSLGINIFTSVFMRAMMRVAKNQAERMG